MSTATMNRVVMNKAAINDAVISKGRNRTSAEGYFIQILLKNGEVQSELSGISFYIENIGKGGFRFLSDVKFSLEDRVQVLLRFPDDHSQEVLGRICYCDRLDENMVAYGFSVIDGFYSLLNIVE